MVINVPVTVVCAGCAQCPRLEIRILTSHEAGTGNVVEREIECRYLDDCLMVQEALKRTGGKDP